MDQIRKNDLVAVTFLDHVESPKEARAEKFTVYGRVAKITSRAVIVGSWCYTSTGRKYDHNTTTYTILRSCIEDIRRLDG